jgi:mercuric ion transport protein
MNIDKLLGFGLVTGLAFLCCAAPLLLVGIGSIGFVAWFAANGALLIPLVLAAIGLAGYSLHRRNRSPSLAATDCCMIDENTRKLKS